MVPRVVVEELMIMVISGNFLCREGGDRCIVADGATIHFDVLMNC